MIDELAELARSKPEIHINPAADTGHILEHAGIDEPTGTWTGGGGPRHGRAIGSDVALADLGAMDRQSAGLMDMTWHLPDALAALYVKFVRDCMTDAARHVHEHPLEWWQNRITAVWSAAWNANYEFIVATEKPSRDRGAGGLLVASFEHNSSKHGMERPHIHNLMPTSGK